MTCTAVSITIVKIAWDREEAEFIAVEAVCRDAYPLRSTSQASSAVATWGNRRTTE